MKVRVCTQVRQDVRANAPAGILALCLRPFHTRCVLRRISVGQLGAFFLTLWSDQIAPLGPMQI